MIDIKYIKNFCNKALEIANNPDDAYDRGIGKQARETLLLIAELEKIEARQEAFEKELREKFGIEEK